MRKPTLVWILLVATTTVTVASSAHARDVRLGSTTSRAKTGTAAALGSSGVWSMRIWMRSFRLPIAVLTALGGVLGASVPAADAAVRCAHRGERVIASSARLVMLAPPKRTLLADEQRKVCDRKTGKRRTLLNYFAHETHGGSVIRHEALRGRFAYVVVSRSSYNIQRSYLKTLDMHSGRIRTADFRLDDQDGGSVVRTDVTDFVAAPHGRAVMRVANDYAAAIVVSDASGTASFLDEGQAPAITPPRVRGDHVTWRHSGGVRSSPLAIPNRCPRAPRPSLTGEPPYVHGLRATADVLASERWFCVRSTGNVGMLDGEVVRLMGPLAVVDRPGDVRVVDLRAQTTVSGPIRGATFGATVGRSGTLIALRRVGPQDVQIVAAAPGAPERQIARGDFYAVRYQDRFIRYRDHTTNRTIEEPLP